MNKKRCKALLPLVQLLPAVAAAAAVLFALPRTVPVLAAVPERLPAVVEQPVEAASSEAEEETLPKLLHHGCQLFRHGGQHRNGAGQGKKYSCRCRHRREQLHQRQQCMASFFVHSNSS